MNLPNPLSILGQALGAAEAYLQQVQLNAITKAVTSLYNWGTRMASYTNGVDRQMSWALSRYHYMFNYAGNIYGGINGYLGTSGSVIESALRGIINQVIPGTAKTITARYQAADKTIGASLSRLWTRVQNDEKQLAADTAWVNKTGYPLAAAWNKFAVVWNKYDAPMMPTLRDWVSKPADLSNTLAPSMTPDVVSQLAQNSNQGLVDKLLRVLLSDLQDVTTAADQGIVALLQSGNY